MAGVYLSYPFCSQKCTYCNFASGVLPLELERDYLAALECEIRRHAWPWTPETVYLGGGTPSRIEPDDLARLLAAIPGRPWAEATIEAAPGGITSEIARAWRDAGIGRVSLGVQSFSERELRQTGRRHTAAVVEHEMAILREAGLDDINVDLIAGLALQTPESWRESLEWIRRLRPPHVSVYMLEVDEDSRLGLEILNNGARFGARDVPNDEATAGFYEEAVEALAAMGIHRYEISNFAEPGRESRHNLKYWRREQYAGFGSDAHGFDGAIRRANVDDVRDYVDRIRRGESPCVVETAADEVEERLMVGLRLTAGVELTEVEWARYGEPIGRFTGYGLLERAGNRLRLTPRGMLLSNEVLQEFIA